MPLVSAPSAHSPLLISHRAATTVTPILNEKTYIIICTYPSRSLFSYGFNGVGMGARAYLRLGKDDEAAETARGGLAEAKKSTTRVECHRVLGIVAARRGDAAGAEGEFLAGAKDARECGVYLLELLCARDLVQFVYEGQGREAEGEPIIEAAAARMGKPMSDFEELLAKRREW